MTRRFAALIDKIPALCQPAPGLAEQGVILRSILAVLAALVVNLAVAAAAEAGLSLAFPPPRGINLSDPAQRDAFMAALPALAYLGLLAGWAVGAFAASATAYFIAGRKVWAAFAGAGVNLFGVLITVATLPHPLWVAAAGLILPVIAAVTVPRFGGAAAV